MGPWCIVNMMLILQVLSIDAHELEWVCNHLGHTTKIHKLHYRATSGLIERIEISKLMLIQENNLVRKYAGRKLSNIQFEGESHQLFKNVAFFKHN